MLGLRWRGRKCRAARRGARAAVSRRSSARRGNSRLRLLPLAIPSPRASPARCAPGIRGPRPRDKAPFGRFAPGCSSRAAVAARLRGLRLRGVRSAPPCPAGAAGAVAGRAAPLPGPHRLPAASRIAAAAWMLPARPRPLRLRRTVRVWARDRRSMAPWIAARSGPPVGGSHGGARGRRTPASGERRPRRCRARPSEVGPGRVKAASAREPPHVPERPARACPARRQAGADARKPAEPDARRAGRCPARQYGIGEDRFPNAWRRARRGAPASGVARPRERRRE